MMRKLLTLASVFVLAACNMAADAQEGALGSGPTTQRSYQLAGFTGVSVAGPHDVIVRVGPAHSVRAEGPADVLDKLEVKLDGRNIEIGMKKGSWRIKGKTVIHITMPAIESAAIAGSGDVRIDRVQGNRFEASIGGSGDIDVAAIDVGEASFSVAGSGNIRASGRAGRSSVSIAGSGDVDLSAVEAQTASVSIVGSGEVRARAMQTADVSIMGSGDVDLTGPARCSVSKMGSGNVRCGGG